MTKLIVCDKTFKAEYFQQFLNKDDRIILCPTTVSYQFNYESLHFADAPLFGLIPKYKTNITKYKDIHKKNYLYHQHIVMFDKNSKWNDNFLINFFNAKKYKTNTKEYLKILEEFHLYLASFDEIIFCCDPCSSGVRGFDFYFKFYLEIENIKKFCDYNNIKLESWIPKSLSSEDIKKAVIEQTSYFKSDIISKIKKYYKTKDYFEYNYNCNSLLLINKSYKEAFGYYPNYVITKNFIQSLFICINKIKLSSNSCIKTTELLKMLVDNNIGHCVSRVTLIKRMESLNFIKTNTKISFNQRNINNESYSLGEKVELFISLLHKKLNDPHLSKRTENDIYNLNFNDFKIKYDRYLKTVFGKQKRFINKNI